MSRISSVVCLSVVRHEDMTPLAQCLHKSATRTERRAINESTELLLQCRKKKVAWKGKLACGSTFQGSVYVLIATDGMIYIAAVRNPMEDEMMWEFMVSFKNALRGVNVDLKAARTTSIGKVLKSMREVMNSFDSSSNRIEESFNSHRGLKPVDEGDESDCSTCDDVEASYDSFSSIESVFDSNSSPTKKALISL